MNLAELTALCLEWQRILRLQDWDVKVRFVRQFEMEGSDGCTRYQQNWKTANIRILDPIDHESDRVHQPDSEQTLVHELMHLQLAGLEPETARMPSFEQGIDLTAWALVKLKRGAA